MGIKVCTKCKEAKPPSEFSKKRRNCEELRPTCKICTYAADKEYRKRNPEIQRASAKRYALNHPDKIKERIEKWRLKNAEHISRYGSKRYLILAPQLKAYRKQWYSKNSERAKEYAKIYRLEHYEQVLETQRKSNKKRIKTPKGKLNNCIKRLMWKSLRGAKANHHWEDLVNFTVDQLKVHLEKLFTSEMNWDNYGIVWEIDHKIPVAVFNYERPGDIDFRICWSLKNLQPLECSKNRSKQAKLDKPFQPALKLAI